MIKVCHITSAHKSDDVRIFYKECVSLSANGYDTYFVARGSSREEKGVHVIGLGQAPTNRLKRMTLFAYKIYKNALRVDASIYHIHDPELLPYAIRLKNKGKKVVFDSHEKYTDQISAKSYLPSYVRNILAWAYGKYEDYVLRRIDAVIFPCTCDGKHPFQGKCDCCITIDNYPVLEELFEKYDSTIEKEPFSVCYVGSITHNRGIGSLVNAIGKTNAHLIIAGNMAPRNYINELSKLPGWCNVEYVGALDRKQVYSLIQKSCIGAATLLNVGQYNKYDNMQTKAYEYMSLGVPVLLTKAPYNETVIKKYGFGLCVDPENKDELAQAIGHILSNPQKAEQMGVNGRKAVLQEFNWKTQEEKLLNLYSRL